LHHLPFPATSARCLALCLTRATHHPLLQDPQLVLLVLQCQQRRYGRPCGRQLAQPGVGQAQVPHRPSGSAAMVLLISSSSSGALLLVPYNSRRAVRHCLRKPRREGAARCTAQLAVRHTGERRWIVCRSSACQRARWFWCARPSGGLALGLPVASGTIDGVQ
jgi:hypothetical protein